MKVKCIDTKAIEKLCEFIIVGQYYLGYDDGSIMYPYIISTLDDVYLISLKPDEYNSCFITIDELRDKQINEILL